MTNQDTLYWIWLAEKCGVASKQFDSLVEKYDSPFDVYHLDEAEIDQLDFVSDGLKGKLCEKNLDASYDTLKYCQQNRVDIISYADARYPARLKSIEDPPIVLYCKGHFPSFNFSLCVGIVGTRSMSEYGRQSAYKIAYDLSRAGVCTVSGMALGIDGVAACGSLAAGGETVAVLGCGIDTAYPKVHKQLMEQIARHGAVITEYPPKEAPHGYNFPKRNRIISGLCQGVLVVEASERSGALITAKNALSQGRDVFALPGKVSDEGSEGPNALIKSGSYPVLSAYDILKHYEFLYGDVIDASRLDYPQSKLPSIDKTLEKYGLTYAVGGAQAEPERVYSVRKGAKRRKSDSEQEPLAAEIATEPQNSADKASKNDEGAGFLATADDVTRRIFEALPADTPVSPDALQLKGVSVAELVTALTMLEIHGLVMTLPGGLYMRK